MDRLQALQTKFRNGEKEIQALKRELEKKTRSLQIKLSELNVQKKANTARRDSLDELQPQVAAFELQIRELERNIEESKEAQHAQFAELSTAEQEVVDEERQLFSGMKSFSQKVERLLEPQLAARNELRKTLGFGLGR